jgi:hypothetical protein
MQIEDLDDLFGRLAHFGSKPPWERRAASGATAADRMIAIGLRSLRGEW